MADLRIQLSVKVDYNEDLKYDGNDILMVEALVQLLKLNKAKLTEDK